MKFFVAFAATLACALAYVPSPAPYYGYAPAPYAGAYAHAPAQITVLPSGFLADTPEVAHAKAAHLAEKAKVASKAAYAPAPYPYAAPAYPAPAYPAPAPAYAAPAYPTAYIAPYAGSYAHAPAPAPVKVLPSGFLADTPEVAHAKAAHLAEKAKVASKAAYAPAPYAYAAPAYHAPAYPAPASYPYGHHY